jgi:hypothetical protein
MNPRPFILLCVLALPAPAIVAAETDARKERQQRIADEVARRRQLREQVAASVADAHRVVREHETGVKKVTAAELAAAQAVVREAGLRGDAPLSNSKEGVQLVLPDADMRTVVTAWKSLFGETVRATEAANKRVVTARLSAPSREVLRPKMIAALRQHGIAVVEEQGGVFFDVVAPSQEIK